uniref:Lymphocyte antigen 86 n=1 Tax=Oncorhynchus kisutch TaxID=8019 RepID=A0A8C7HY88_ONCKI
NMDKLQIFYHSCDPLQDIGIIVNTCLPMPPSYKGNLRVSLLLRQSIEELYLSTTVLTGVVAPSSHDEPLCLPDFPRFSFCSWKKGGIIDYEKPVKLKNLDNLPLDVHVVLVNQYGYHIACFNVTFIKDRGDKGLI